MEALGLVDEGDDAKPAGELVQVVINPAGGAVPGASVNVTQTDTGLNRTAETDANGSYFLPSLPVGP